jgi:hypothetical protein
VSAHRRVSYWIILGLGVVGLFLTGMALLFTLTYIIHP